jgi:hypothetical protein
MPATSWTQNTRLNARLLDLTTSPFSSLDNKTIMADIADIAYDLQEAELNFALHMRRKGPILRPVGTCYYCDQDVTGNRLFCDKDCSKDWEDENRVQNISRRGQFND